MAKVACLNCEALECFVSCIAVLCTTAVRQFEIILYIVRPYHEGRHFLVTSANTQPSCTGWGTRFGVGVLTHFCVSTPDLYLVKDFPAYRRMLQNSDEATPRVNVQAAHWWLDGRGGLLLSNLVFAWYESVLGIDRCNLVL
jgi:hypothetical protein